MSAGIAAIHGNIDLARGGRRDVPAPQNRRPRTSARFHGLEPERAAAADASVGVAVAWFGLFAIIVVRAVF
jgi:hypothetical protein